MIWTKTKTSLSQRGCWNNIYYVNHITTTSQLLLWIYPSKQVYKVEIPILQRRKFRIKKCQVTFHGYIYIWWGQNFQLWIARFLGVSITKWWNVTISTWTTWMCSNVSLFFFFSHKVTYLRLVDLQCSERGSWTMPDSRRTGKIRWKRCQMHSWLLLLLASMGRRFLQVWDAQI